jgi:hypothetical protein
MKITGKIVKVKYNKMHGFVEVHIKTSYRNIVKIIFAKNEGRFSVSDVGSRIAINTPEPWSVELIGDKPMEHFDMVNARIL